MKSLVILLMFGSLSLNAFSNELTTQKIIKDELSKDLSSDFAQEVRKEIALELGATPVLINNISNHSGMDGNYVGLFKKNGQTFSFQVFISYGTQGAFSTSIRHITLVPSL